MRTLHLKVMKLVKSWAFIKVSRARDNFLSQDHSMVVISLYKIILIQPD